MSKIKVYTPDGGIRTLNFPYIDEQGNVYNYALESEQDQLLNDIRQELKAIRMMLSSATNSNFSDEDVSKL